MGDHLTAGTGASSRGIHSFPREEILRTEALWRRPKRPPDHESENHALARLVQVGQLAIDDPANPGSIKVKSHFEVSAHPPFGGFPQHQDSAG